MARDSTSPGLDANGAWTLFWQSDRLHACVPHDEAAFEDLQRHWHEVFYTLPSGARVLDLGTGNGSLAVHVLRTAREQRRNVEVHGVDAADIDPRRHAASISADLAAVHFHPQTPMESLPFTDDCFDLVCGQFAFEYSDTSRTTEEIARVLRPGGSLQLLMHTGDAVLAKQVGRQRTCLVRVQESALFPHLLRLLELLLEARQRGAGATVPVRKAIGDFKAELDVLASAMADETDAVLARDVLNAVEPLPGMTVAGHPDPLRLARELRKRLSAQVARLRDMERACLDREELDRVVAEFEAVGMCQLSVCPARVGTSKVRIGCWLSASKEALSPG